MWKAIKKQTEIPGTRLGVSPNAVSSLWWSLPGVTCQFDQWNKRKTSPNPSLCQRLGAYEERPLVPRTPSSPLPWGFLAVSGPRGEARRLLGRVWGCVNGGKTPARKKNTHNPLAKRVEMLVSCRSTVGTKDNCKNFSGRQECEGSGGGWEGGGQPPCPKPGPRLPLAQILPTAALWLATHVVVLHAQGDIQHAHLERLHQRLLHAEQRLALHPQAARPTPPSSAPTWSPGRWLLAPGRWSPLPGLGAPGTGGPQTSPAGAALQGDPTGSISEPFPSAWPGCGSSGIPSPPLAGRQGKARLSPPLGLDLLSQRGLGFPRSPLPPKAGCWG